MSLLNLVQIGLGIGLVIGILVQQRGSSLGSAFGSDSAVYSSRRGVEKIVFRATILLALLFGIVSVVQIIF